VVVGGNGVRRTLPLAARYADEWNAVFLKAEAFVDLNTRLDGPSSTRAFQPVSTSAYWWRDGPYEWIMAR
jgi:hypothetical protein